MERQAGRKAGKQRNAIKNDIWADSGLSQKPQSLLKQHKYTLSDCNETQTHNHFVRRPTLNNLAKLPFWQFDVLAVWPVSRND